MFTTLVPEALMAVPSTAEVAVPVTITTIGLTAAFGHDLTFWVVVCLAAFLKYRWSDPLTDRNGEELTGRRWAAQMFINLLASVIPPYIGAKGLAELAGVPEDSFIYWLIVAGLVLTGEGLVRWLIRSSKTPEALLEFIIRIWRGGGK